MAFYRLPFNLTDGRPAYGCIHMRDWSDSYQRCLIRAGIIKRSLDCVQAQGGSSKSGGTHLEGTALDLIGSQCKPEPIRIAREGGARATWGRGGWVRYLGAVARALNFGDHIHLAIDCPCTSGADYQLDEADQGYDGLVGNGRDYHPRPKVRRDWRQGIAWMDAQYLPTPTITTPTIKPTAAVGDKDWSDMATKAEIESVVRKVVREELNRPFAGPWLATFGKGADGKPRLAMQAIRDAIKQAVKR